MSMHDSLWYPLNLYLIKYKEDIVVFLDFKVFKSDNSCSKNAKVTFIEEPKLKKIISIQNEKHWYIINTW